MGKPLTREQLAEERRRENEFVRQKYSLVPNKQNRGFGSIRPWEVPPPPPSPEHTGTNTEETQNGNTNTED